MSSYRRDVADRNRLFAAEINDVELREEMGRLLTSFLPSSGFKGLYDGQERALLSMMKKVSIQNKKIVSCQSMLLDMEVATGKTYLSILLLMWWFRYIAPFRHHRGGKALLVMKKGIFSQWRESLRNTGLDMNVFVYHKSVDPNMDQVLIDADDSQKNSPSTPSIVITSYDYLKNQDKLKEMEFDAFLTDEIHNLSSPDAERTQNLKNLTWHAREIRQNSQKFFCLGLSGTVITNHMMQLYNTLVILNPCLLNVLGDTKRFQKKYEKPITKGLNSPEKSSEFRHAEVLQKELLSKISDYIEKLEKSDILYHDMSWLLEKRRIHDLPPPFFTKGLPIIMTSLLALTGMSVLQWEASQIILTEDPVYPSTPLVTFYNHDTQQIDWDGFLSALQSHLPNEVMIQFLTAYFQDHGNEQFLSKIAWSRYLASHPLLGFRDYAGGQRDFENMIEFVSKYRDEEIPSPSAPGQWIPLWEYMLLDTSEKTTVMFRFLNQLLELEREQEIEDQELDVRMRRQGKISIVSESAKDLRIWQLLMDIKGESYHVLDGTVNLEKRTEIQKDVNNPESRVKILLMTRATGGEGLNFPMVKYVLEESPWYTFASRKQVEGRVTRVGQVNDPLKVDFVTAGTSETTMLKIGTFKHLLHVIQRSRPQQKVSQEKLEQGSILSRLFTESETKMRYQVIPSNEEPFGDQVRRLVENPLKESIGGTYELLYPYVEYWKSILLESGALDVVNLDPIYMETPPLNAYGEFLNELAGQYHACSASYGKMSLEEFINREMRRAASKPRRVESRSGSASGSGSSSRSSAKIRRAPKETMVLDSTVLPVEHFFQPHLVRMSSNPERTSTFLDYGTLPEPVVSRRPIPPPKKPRKQKPSGPPVSIERKRFFHHEEDDEMELEWEPPRPSEKSRQPDVPAKKPNQEKLSRFLQKVRNTKQNTPSS